MYLFSLFYYKYSIETKTMPYKIRKKGKGYKVCKTSGKCYSKKPLSKKMAQKQRAAIAINTYEKFNYFSNLIKSVLNE